MTTCTETEWIVGSQLRLKEPLQAQASSLGQTVSQKLGKLEELGCCSPAPPKPRNATRPIEEMDPSDPSSATQQHAASPTKLSHQSPDDAHTWSDDGSSADEDRDQNGGSSKRKRPLSVSCET